MQAQSLVRQLAALDDRSDLKQLVARLATIERATGRLESLIDMLLDVSELTVGEFTPKFSEFDLGDLARAIAARSAADAERAGCRIVLSETEQVIGQWDRSRMERVVASLISNAMKYGAGQPVEITVRKHGTRARLSVRDHGIGIPREEQGRIFEMFGRGVPARHFGGFGLGLWIAKQIIEAHGGHFLLWSRPAEGSEFTVDLPLRPSAEISLPRTAPPEVHP
jgi:signal transduction histidine kinase